MLLLVYHQLAHYAVFLRNSHKKGSERTHGKWKVAQLKWQLLLSVDSQSISSYVQFFKHWWSLILTQSVYSFEIEKEILKYLQSNKMTTFLGPLQDTKLFMVLSFKKRVSMKEFFTQKSMTIRKIVWTLWQLGLLLGAMKKCVQGKKWRQQYKS